MKANFILIGLCIILLPAIYFINNQQNHWTQLLPLGYLAYSFVVGTISWINGFHNKKR